MSSTTGINGFPSPQLGSGYTDNAFVVVGALGAVIWDMISNLNFDYHLVRDFRITWTVVVYFISRLATFAAFVLASVSDTRPIKDCSVVLSAASWIFAVAISSTSLLFFFRVRAMYTLNRYVVGSYFLLWLAVVAGSIVGARARDPFDLTVVVITINVIPMANNALGFIAVTWKLMKNTHVAMTLKNGLEVMVFGHNLPKFSKALLKDSQICFLTIVSVHIGSVAVFYSRGGFQPVNFAFFLPNVAVMNLMGSRIYRNTRLGIRSLSDVQSTSFPLQSSLSFRRVEDAETGDATVTVSTRTET